ncbi:hypothetical protein RG007_003402 [Vibrio parahaemolyticus]|nr:hypothetical protein [Vibrio parahaemolyticus]ELA9726321.1 hypothetical protein [Vibrio parahaemolyticus]HBC3528450.1 hypothetical protein [Vibrio parahaemolyticus]
MNIRCLVKADGDLYVAMSLEFGLAAQADTVDGAFEKLKDQIDEYVSEALEQDSEHRAKLLNRKAPVIWYVWYYFAKFFNQRRNSNRQGSCITTVSHA